MCTTRVLTLGMLAVAVSSWAGVEVRVHVSSSMSTPCGKQSGARDRAGRHDKLILPSESCMTMSYFLSHSLNSASFISRISPKVRSPYINLGWRSQVLLSADIDRKSHSLCSFICLLSFDQVELEHFVYWLVTNVSRQRWQ